MSRILVLKAEDNGRLLPLRDKIVYRRKRVAELYLQGWIQTKISFEIQCSLSTVEKDLKYIRENVESIDGILE